MLSIFAGAAEILPDALLVNPYDADETAHAIDVALKMPLEERKERWGQAARRHRATQHPRLGRRLPARPPRRTAALNDFNHRAAAVFPGRSSVHTCPVGEAASSSAIMRVWVSARCLVVLALCIGMFAPSALAQGDMFGKIIGLALEKAREDAEGAA